MPVKGLSASQRTLNYLREQGMLVGIVEKWIPTRTTDGRPSGFRSDFLKIIDVIGLSPSEGIVGVQSCGQDFLNHRKKITETEADSTRAWLEAGGRMMLIGWKKNKKRKSDGSWSKQGYWTPRVEEILIEHLQ